MVSFKNLPRVGRDFSTRVGLGSFEKKLSTAAISSSSALHVLRGKKALGALVTEVGKRQRYIRAGGLTTAQRRSIKAAVVASDKTLSYTGRRVVGQVLEGLGRGSAVVAPKIATPEKATAHRRAATVQSWRMQRRSSENASKPTGFASRPGSSSPSALSPVVRPPVLQR